MLGNIMAQQGGISALSQGLQNQQRSQGISQAASGAGTLAGGLMEYLPKLLSLLGL
jgi:X-X-X-Leu-X-X-Gly heptad repeat protein